MKWYTVEVSAEQPFPSITSMVILSPLAIPPAPEKVISLSPCTCCTIAPLTLKVYVGVPEGEFETPSAA